MSWIALTDLSQPVFNIRGIGVPADAPGARPPASVHEIMPTGTLMLELRAHGGGDGPWRFLNFERDRDWPREITAEITTDGRLVMAFRQGVVRSRAEIALPPIPRDGHLRVSYSWDAPRRSAFLTVEFLNDGRIFQARSVNPVPLPVGDIKAMIRNGHATRVDGAGIAGDTPVETTDGPVSVDRLRLGDMVMTAGAGSQPVRWIVKHTVPAMGSFRPIRLRAPFLGLGRDVVVASRHRVRLDLTEAEYMLGDNEVLVPAVMLANGKHAKRETRHRLVSYYQILLDVHDCLLHDGLWGESLFLGAMARQPGLIANSALGALPVTALPVHRAFKRAKLSGLELRNLAASLQLA